MSLCGKCGKDFNKQIIINCIICNTFFHATTACTGATASEVKVFELKQVKPVLSYRCDDCRKNNIPLALQETLNELDIEFKKFKSNYVDLLKSVKDLKSEISCVPLIKKEVEFINSEVFSEKIIAESVLRIKKAKNFIIYDVPENNVNFESDIAFVKDMLADIPISLEGIKCFRRNASKAGSPEPLVVTLSDADSVVTVFKNKNKLKEELIIKRDRTKQESKL